MPVNDTIGQILSELRKLFPRGMGNDVEKNFRAALQGVFERVDLVTREELDVQEQVLARTRARLEEMEKRVAELEAKLK
jgi:ubiquinone biosynthesis accessory factor UbiK